ncbi:MAG: M18 family aminopeptidase [Gammaproteobacteria bacterium]|nr:M18 family aminopeptidase [Gammaproteobacteria bacterium]
MTEKLMRRAEFNHSLMGFIAESPTPFHAVQAMAKRLRDAGYSRLKESDSWELVPGQGYYVTRNDSSIVALCLGAADVVRAGIRMVGAHTDSPCLKVKPQPEVHEHSYFQLGVEVYGGALLNPWFDRDLSLAGRVSYTTIDDQILNALIDFSRPVAVIPSLAIHLDRKANKNRSVNPQTDLPPVLCQAFDSDAPDFRTLLLDRLREQHPESGAQEILDYELSLYDTQPPCVLGLREDFIAAARLDNLLSCYTGLMGLLSSDGDSSCLLVCNDHEEVGSMSAGGAQGPFLKYFLQRVCGTKEKFLRAIDRSMMISADNAHGIHPNFADKHDSNHGPKFNQGPVIKINSNQRYASNSETAAVFRRLCAQVDVPVQSFVVRTDLACGTTIGPLTAGELGVRTLDIGVAQLAMHSIRELAGSQDTHYLYKALRHFFESQSLGLQ